MPLPPGNIAYEEGFTDTWHKIVGKDSEDELCNSLLKFIERVFGRISLYGYNNSEREEEQTLKRWRPEVTAEFCSLAMRT